MSHIPREKIFILQLADAPLMKMDVLEWSRHHRCFPGQGELDILSFMAEFDKTGYKGVLSLEVFNDNLRNTPPEQTAADGIRSLRWLEAEVSLPP
jgi:4-hydroxyphenylpyruvate dioxygenase